MKKLIFYTVFLLSVGILLSSCKKNPYPGGTISPYIPLYDLRNIHRGQDVTLNIDNMFGSEKITGIVISDYAEKNLPEGYLIVQDRHRLNELRGIAIPLGADAANYVSGDSVIVHVAGGILTRVNGMLQIKNVPTSAVTKVSSGNTIPAYRVPSRNILKDPTKYESTLVAIVKGGFDPVPTAADKFAGDKVVNDGFDNIILHTEAAATFADNSLPVSANYYGIVYTHPDEETGELVPEVRLRKGADVQLINTVMQDVPAVITGYLPDARGGDGNYEYMQFLALRNINFAQTPFSVITTNNAGTAEPTGFPENGWVTGGARTYKINITSGSVAKGEFFYVGGSNRRLNGSGSTNISAAKWVRQLNYNTTGANGVGNPSGGLFANSGNGSGFALFNTTNVTRNTTPIDVVFIERGGTLFGPRGANDELHGYRVADNDVYDSVDPITQIPQPFYTQGSNTIFFNYPSVSDVGMFMKLGGEYNVRLKRWVKARSQWNHLLPRDEVPFEEAMKHLEEYSLITLINRNTGEETIDTVHVTKIIE